MAAHPLGPLDRHGRYALTALAVSRETRTFVFHVKREPSWFHVKQDTGRPGATKQDSKKGRTHAG
ncbi:hypothetical protein ACFU9Y_43970, partial [Streptomyces sp. NPDC057621]|uniref:hypothetical protein n=1 Tax=Streptomyces sp. NPDC057621 TaxID=3346186 RepID=UPI003693172A